MSVWLPLIIKQLMCIFFPGKARKMGLTDFHKGLLYWNFVGLDSDYYYYWEDFNGFHSGR
jgi:hypothetical protein